MDPALPLAQEIGQLGQKGQHFALGLQPPCPGRGFPLLAAALGFERATLLTGVRSPSVARCPTCVEDRIGGDKKARVKYLLPPAPKTEESQKSPQATLAQLLSVKSAPQKFQSGKSEEGGFYALP